MTDTEYTNLSNWKALQHVNSILRDMSGDDVLTDIEINEVRFKCATMHQKYSNDVFNIEEIEQTKKASYLTIDEFQIEIIEGSFEQVSECRTLLTSFDIFAPKTVDAKTLLKTWAHCISSRNRSVITVPDIYYGVIIDCVVETIEYLDNETMTIELRSTIQC